VTRRGLGSCNTRFVSERGTIENLLVHFPATDCQIIIPIINLLFTNGIPPMYNQISEDARIVHFIFDILSCKESPKKGWTGGPSGGGYASTAKFGEIQGGPKINGHFLWAIVQNSGDIFAHKRPKIKKNNYNIDSIHKNVHFECPSTKSVHDQP